MFDMIAKTMSGLEEVLAEELRALGAQRIDIAERAVHFVGDTDLMFRANLCLRTSFRVLKPIHTLQVRTVEELYEKMKEIKWTDYMSAQDTFAIDGVVNSRLFNHSQYVALKTKDAIADWFRERLGYRPSVDVQNPRVRFNVHIFDDCLTLSMDTSGDSLHMRGYRRDSNEAPLNEILAAGMIALSGWKGDTPFVDPMCGSGTLPIEAAMLARNAAPNLARREFGFTRWRDYNAKNYRKILDEVKGMERPVAVPIIGSDISRTNIAIASDNLERTGLSRVVTLQAVRIQQSVPPEGPGGTLICNPPYGERMQVDAIEALYADIGDAFEQRYTGWQAWLISNNIDAMKHIGLRATQKIPLLNGKLQCQFRQYELY